MSIISRFLAELVEIEEAELCELERLVRALRLKRPFHATKVRLAGLAYFNADGEVIVSTQVLKVGQPMTGALIFTDANGNTGKGPVGTVASSGPAVTASLSADGQALNAELVSDLASGTPGETVTITWSDPSGVIPDTVLVTVIEEAAEFVATSVVLAGDLVDGTTA